MIPTLPCTFYGFLNWLSPLQPAFAPPVTVLPTSLWPIRQLKFDRRAIPSFLGKPLPFSLRKPTPRPSTPQIPPGKKAGHVLRKEHARLVPFVILRAALEFQLQGELQTSRHGNSTGALHKRRRVNISEVLWIEIERTCVAHEERRVIQNVKRLRPERQLQLFGQVEVLPRGNIPIEKHRAAKSIQLQVPDFTGLWIAETSGNRRSTA